MRWEKEKKRMARRVLLLLLACFAWINCLLISGAEAADLHYYEMLRTQNAGHLAKKMAFIPTTEQAVAFAFGGLSRTSTLDDILQRLDDNGMKATFFVTEREIKRNGANIEKIIAHGHEIGIGLRPEEKDGFFETCGQLDRIRTGLLEKFGVKTNLVRQMFGMESSEIDEAVSAMGCSLIGQTVNVVQTKDKEANSPDEVMPKIFGKWLFSLGRGQIVYIRLDFYTDETLAGDMMMAIKQQKVDNVAYRTYDDSPEGNSANDSAYRISAVGDLLYNSDKRYDYPVDPVRLDAEVRPSYIPVKVDANNFMTEFYKRYIGSPEVNETDRMLGFSKAEMAKADKTGIVKTVKDNTIFLTFDDWGTDQAINKILYVLRKHHVTGTFFTITRNMPNNPNLLRAIAMDGNEIGSHTDAHKAMAVRDPKTKLQVPVLAPDVYAKDEAVAYEKLAAAVGDVVIDGRHSLTRFFRPPTLALSKTGVEGAFAAGYTYMVSGYESTEDYNAIDLQTLVGALQAGIYDEKSRVRNGSIIVMHMSDTAKLTPRALDIMLTINEKRADDNPKKFKIGRLSDYLANDYSQMMKVETAK